MGTSKKPHFIPTDGTTSHSTRPPKNGNQVAGYAALHKKFLAYISKHMRRGEIFYALCIWANSEFLEVPYPYSLRPRMRARCARRCSVSVNALGFFPSNGFLLELYLSLIHISEPTRLG